MTRREGPASTDRLLTPAALLNDFGPRSPLAQEGISSLMAAARHFEGQPALARWKVLFERCTGRSLDKLPGSLMPLAARCGCRCEPHNAPAILFALQTYYVMVIEQAVARFGRAQVSDLLPENPFSWAASRSSPAIAGWLERVRKVMHSYRATLPADAPAEGYDLFKPLYQALFPRTLRHRLGEYYTPDWLAEHLLDQVGYAGAPTDRLLDPSCGSGTFLLAAIRRLRRRLKVNGGVAEDPTANTPPSPFPLPPSSSHPSSLISPPIVGFDINPLAVIAARANYLIAIADLLPKGAVIEIPVYLWDSIQQRGQEPAGSLQPFDYVVGNPPWIAWDNLPDEDRQATKPLWHQYGLFSLSANEARHGGGKKDLAMLMLYVAADKYLRAGGRLGMVITQTLFQTKGAGDGFRRFRLGPDGPPLRVLRVDDMVSIRPFGEAANWTSTIVLEKGAKTVYPVPYVKWTAAKGEGGRGKGEESNDECGMMKDEVKGSGFRVQGSDPDIHHSSFILHHSDGLPSPFPLPPSYSHPSAILQWARPIDPDKATSPWLVSRDREATGQLTARCHRPSPSDYKAHLGANSGGANGVFWVEVVGEAEGGVLVRNLASKGKRQVPAVETVIEPDLLYPLLRWGDVERYRATPRAYIILAQDPRTRSGIDEAVMRERYPRTFCYLEQSRDLLESRAAYRRYQQHGSFYSMYNVGPYTIAPLKVVWRRMDRRINAAVVETPTARPPVAALFLRPAIPQETCVLIDCQSSDEAHYLCAMLNSAVVNDIVAAHSVSGGKGFGTPGMLDFLPIRRYQSENPHHLAIASLSRRAHAALNPCLASGTDNPMQPDTTVLASLQSQIDRAVSVMD